METTRKRLEEAGAVERTAKISLIPAFRYVPLRSARALGGGAHKEIRARARKNKKDSSRSSRTLCKFDFSMFLLGFYSQALVFLVFFGILDAFAIIREISLGFS